MHPILKCTFYIIQTYNTDRNVGDSAACATAFLAGEKAKAGTIGVSQKVPKSNCTAQKEPGNELTSVLKHAMKAGKECFIYYTYMYCCHTNKVTEKGCPIINVLIKCKKNYNF